MKLLVVNPDIFLTNFGDAIVLAQYVESIRVRFPVKIMNTHRSGLMGKPAFKKMGPHLPGLLSFCEAPLLPHHPSLQSMENRIDLINRRWPAFDVDWMAITADSMKFDAASAPRVIALNDPEFDLHLSLQAIYEWLNSPENPVQYSRQDPLDLENDDWATLARAGILEMCDSRKNDSKSVMQYVVERLHAECAEHVTDVDCYRINPNKIPQILKPAFDAFVKREQLIGLTTSDVSMIEMFDVDDFLEFIYEKLHKTVPPKHSEPFLVPSRLL